MEFGGLNTMLIAKSVDCIERKNFNTLLLELIETFDTRLAFNHASEIQFLSFILYYMPTFLSEEGNTAGLSYAALQVATEQLRISVDDHGGSDVNNTNDSTAVISAEPKNRCLAALLYGILPYLKAKFSIISNFVVKDIGNLGGNAEKVMRAIDPLGPSWHPKELTENQKVERVISFGNDILHWLFLAYGHYLDLPMRISTLRVLHTYRSQVPTAMSRVDKFHAILARLMMLKIVLSCIAGLQGLYSHIKQLRNEVIDENDEDESSIGMLDENELAAAASSKVIDHEEYPFERSCVICRENIRGPSVIPCGHIFCWECVQTLARTGPTNLVSMKSFKCPYCSQIFHVDMIRPLFFTITPP